MFFQKKNKPEVRVKTKGEQALDFLNKAFFWLLGAFIVAVALEMFLLPNKIIDGGVIGISMMVSYVTKWNLGLLIFCIKQHKKLDFVLFSQIFERFFPSLLYNKKARAFLLPPFI